MLLILLVLTIGFGAIFVPLNLRLGNDALALAEAALMIYAALIIRPALRTDRLQRLIVSFLLPFFAILMFALIEAGTDPSIYCWVLVVPVLSYLLLGSQLGLAVAVFVLAATAGAFFLRFGYSNPMVNVNSIFNVLLCALSILGFSHVHELSRARNEAELQRLAVTDPLTGLANREWFRHVFETERRRAERRESVASVLVLDLDHFKRINDRLGHDAGDEALCRAAELLRARMRPGDTLCRLGGEEFVVLLPGTVLEAGADIAETLRLAIAGAEWRYNGELHRLTTSIGVAELGADGVDLAGVFGVADARLYQAKQRGRDRVVARGAA